jgi:aminomuconate-semialdehyde/2-hydroxymuconate-6-semialdehyde dehydrogenase
LKTKSFIPTIFKILVEIILNYINGELKPSQSNEFIDNISPRTGKIYSKITRSNSNDVKLAIESAKQAFSSWSILPTIERAKILNRIADLIEEKLPELAKAETIDNGKPISLSSTVDIPRSAYNFRFFASLIQHFQSESYSSLNTIDVEIKTPLGVVGCISPWNLPLYLLTWKIAPAIAAGNCVIAKPSEITPMTAYLLSKICIDAGLPPGVLNIVHGFGSEIGDSLCSHPEIKAISFTGSTTTGRQISKTTAPYFKKLSLEMGGKNPTIIFADANYNKMVETTILSSFSNQGEICFCGERIYVERSLYEIFKEDFLKQIQKLKVGDPLDPETQIGAIVSKEHLEKIQMYQRLAEEEGGTILFKGDILELEGELSGGYYILPTVIENLDINCRVNQEEVFGPFVTLTPFDSEGELIELANGTEYGLSAVIWTENLSRVYRLVHQIQAGIIWINCWMVRDLNTPFGGMKNSGLGREGGLHALKFFTESKNVTLKLDSESLFSYKF